MNATPSTLRRRAAIAISAASAALALAGLTATLPASHHAAARPQHRAATHAVATAGRSPLCGDGETLHIPSGVACTHGDDTQFAPGPHAEDGDTMDAADVIVANAPRPSRRELSTMNIPCSGNGTSGNRVRVYYAYPSGSANRVASARSTIVRAIKQTNYILDESAHSTGGSRFLRVYSDNHCNPIVSAIAVPRSSLNTLDGTIAYAEHHGLNATNRKYVIFADGVNTICGQGTLSLDSQPGPFNAANGGPSWALIDKQCWSGPVMAHELLHTLGAVQRGAPHYDGTGHCTDDHDLMCYDAGGKKTYIRCRSALGEYRADCGSDDYFNTHPAKGSYLATHWNTAMNSFLYGGGPATPKLPHAPVIIVDRMTNLHTAVVSWRAARGDYVTSWAVGDSDGGNQYVGRWTSWTDTHAYANKSYVVQAVNPLGISSPSKQVTLHLPAPQRPTKVTVHGLTVSWTSTTTFTSGFRLVGLNASSRSLITSVASSARSAQSNANAGLLGLIGKVSYTGYQVCAFNASGETCRAA